MLIRPFTPADIPAAAAVLRRAAETFILHESRPEDAAAFLAEHDAAGLRRNLDAGFVYHAADVDGGLAGFIGVRGGTHVYHLFVDACWQRRGIARALWLAARAAALQPGGHFHGERVDRVGAVLCVARLRANGPDAGVDGALQPDAAGGRFVSVRRGWRGSRRRGVATGCWPSLRRGSRSRGPARATSRHPSRPSR